MTMMDDPDMLPMAAAAAAAATILVVVMSVVYLSCIVSKNGNKNDHDDKEPKQSTAGIIETIREISGPDAPFFVLRSARQLNALNYKLNLPFLPGKGVFVIGSAPCQREILLHPKADRPASLASSAIQITGHPSIGTRMIADPAWKLVRKGSSPAFSSSEVSRMSLICKRHVDEWIQTTLDQDPLLAATKNDTKTSSETTKNATKTTATFDPSVEMTKLSFCIIMEAAFEYKCTDQEVEVYLEHLQIALQEFFLRQMANPFRKLFGAFIPQVRKAHQSVQRMQEFCLKVLLAHRNNKQDSNNANTLINLIDQLDLTDQQKVSELSVFLIAGHDTTGYTLATTLILLAQHPDKFRNLKQQQDQPSDYLSWVIMESRRLFPVAGISTVRETPRDFTFTDMGTTQQTNSERTIVIPQGATVFLPQIIAHRDPAIFANPDQFEPERWENATQEMMQSILTFSVGARKCIGQSLAMAELDSILPAILAKYEFEIEEPGHLEFFMTLKFAGTKLRAVKKCMKE